LVFYALTFAARMPARWRSSLQLPLLLAHAVAMVQRAHRTGLPCRSSKMRRSWKQSAGE
jgi:hypothetical protein